MHSIHLYVSETVCLIRIFHSNSSLICPKVSLKDAAVAAAADVVATNRAVVFPNDCGHVSKKYVCCISISSFNSLLECRDIRTYARTSVSPFDLHLYQNANTTSALRARETDRQANG